MQNESWGVRGLEEVSEEAKKNDFIEEELIRMRANNFSVIYRKGSL